MKEAVKSTIILLAWLSTTPSAQSQFLPAMDCVDPDRLRISCKGRNLECPRSEDGVIKVADYDLGMPIPGGDHGPADGFLGADELQCAIDCLDGDPYQEFTPSEAHPTFTTRWAYPIIDGGIIEFAPGLEYAIDRTLKLPFGTRSPLILRGNGAEIKLLAPEPGGLPPRPGRLSHAAFEKIAQPAWLTGELEALAGWCNRWLIEGFTIVAPPDPLPDRPVRGIEVHASVGLVIRDCEVRNTDVGIGLRFAVSPSIIDCSFEGSRVHDVGLVGVDDCWDGSGRPCWGEVNQRCFVNSGFTTETGANDALVGGTTHRTTAGGCDEAISMLALDGDALVMDDVLFTGCRPLHAIRAHRWQGNGTWTLRNARFDVDGPAGAGALIRGHVLGSTFFDGIDLADRVGGHWLQSDNGTAERLVAINALRRLPSGATMSVSGGEWTVDHSFRHLASESATLEEEPWDADRWIGVIPRQVAVEGAHRQYLSNISPQAQDHGALGMTDTASWLSFRYCCADDTAPGLNLVNREIRLE